MWYNMFVMGAIITVASANTESGRMLREGFDAVSHVDVLLMQEVLGQPSQTARQLDAYGFELAHVDPGTGLAIARSQDSLLEVVEGGQEMAELSPALWRGAAASDLRTLQRLRARAAIGLTLRHRLIDTELFVVTAHPVVPVRARARARQIRALGAWLANYPADAVVLGADMNHYPAPGRVDAELEQMASMKRVELGDEPTWRMAGSNSERLGRMMGFVTRRDLASFDGQLDAILYRGALRPKRIDVVDIPSDHRAIVTSFDLGGLLQAR